MEFFFLTITDALFLLFKTGALYLVAELNFPKTVVLFFGPKLIFSKKVLTDFKKKSNLNSVAASNDMHL